MLTQKSNSANEQSLSLWEKFLSGDDRAYTHLYNEYVEVLFSYGMRFTSDRELVKDCIQDVFVKIYKNRSHLNRTDNVKLYFFIALKNTLFNVFHKDKNAYHIDTVEPVFAVEYSIEDQLIADEQEQEKNEKINRMLESLTPRQKEVIYYRYVEGLTMEEICTSMKMNYQSVQNLIQRSIKKIRTTFPEKDKSILSIKFKSNCS
jgi:RNA polymerase sigma factor (sigma-70 family)